jgi:hypothetical protein
MLLEELATGDNYFAYIIDDDKYLCFKVPRYVDTTDYMMQNELYDIMDSTYEFYWLGDNWKLTKTNSSVIRSNREKYFPRKSS